MSNKELLKNPSFLQAVICQIADEAFDDEEVLGDVGQGCTWPTKSAWINDKISSWFEATSNKIKAFQHKDRMDLKVKSIHMAKLMYNMSLGDIVYIENSVGEDSVRRVPGGWLYTVDSTSNMDTSFIPFDNEFQALSHEEDLIVLKDDE